ncbi:DoxX family protein [Pedobacter nototheniae]|uniref:DoxX family protein n=1 Tax=Pedobacter nototheniae TaxID=2488994 RepID=UPI00292CD26E|nr:DoxX family protein [Pedobacter nototheniae]
MKIAVIIVRVLLGALFLFSSAAVLFKLAPQPVLTGDVKTFMVGVTVSIYLMPLIKVTEMICALSLLAGRYTALALVILFPISINILLYHIYLSPKEAPVAIIILIAHLFLAYAYRKNYAGLFQAKRIE